jgi:hypothetical protein
LFLFAGNFVPRAGDLFDFLTAGSVIGLETLSLAFGGLPSGFDFDFDLAFTGDSLRLTLVSVNAAPEPTSVGLLAIALVTLIWSTRRGRHLCRPTGSPKEDGFSRSARSGRYLAA